MRVLFDLNIQLLFALGHGPSVHRKAMRVSIQARQDQRLACCREGGREGVLHHFVPFTRSFLICMNKFVPNQTKQK